MTKLLIEYQRSWCYFHVRDFYKAVLLSHGVIIMNGLIIHSLLPYGALCRMWVWGKPIYRQHILTCVDISQCTCIYKVLDSSFHCTQLSHANIIHIRDPNPISGWFFSFQIKWMINDLKNSPFFINELLKIIWSSQKCLKSKTVLFVLQFMKNQHLHTYCSFHTARTAG